MRRGDITGMSFAFMDDYEDSENGVSYERTEEVIDGKEVWIRHVKRITGLYDVAIVTNPAYEQTSVATREHSDSIEAVIEAQLQRSQESEKTDELQNKTDETEKENNKERERSLTLLRKRLSLENIIED
jgi:phage head maturation protease